MKPVLPTPADVAKARYTSKTNLQRNIDLVSGLKAANLPEQNALNYLALGFAISTSRGQLLDGWGERFGITRAGRSDDEYRAALQLAAASSSVSMQSRPAIGSYLRQVYGITWLSAGAVGLPGGAVGAALNRVPFRMVFAQLGSTAPDMTLPDDLASATLGVDVYSAAIPPSVTLAHGAALFPGNVFKCVWGGLVYKRSLVTIRADTGKALNFRNNRSLNTRVDNTDTVASNDLVEPYNTLTTVKRMGVQNG